MTDISADDMNSPLDTEDNDDQHKGGAMVNSSTNLISTTVAGTEKKVSYPKNLVLDIGGRKFKVSRDTLQAESGLFRRQLSDRFTWDPEADGSYFLDADPDLFEHLLRFMRRPEVFPLFYDAAKGFDYNLYSRLQAESVYFQVDVLHEWIKNKNYLNAIKVLTSNPKVRNIEHVSLVRPEVLPVNKTEEWHVIPRTWKVYLCPRQIGAHRGQPEQCGQACHRRQAGFPVEYEEATYLEVISVEKEIVFDEQVCKIY